MEVWSKEEREPELPATIMISERVSEFIKAAV